MAANRDAGLGDSSRPPPVRVGARLSAGSSRPPLISPDEPDPPPLPMPGLPAAVEPWGVAVDLLQRQRLERFAGWLMWANTRANLTAIREPPLVERLHILDSLSLLPLIYAWQARRPASRAAHRPVLLDVGTGGGVPGLPLAIMLPEFDVLLVESVSKKAALLEDAVRRLELGERVRIVNERVEVLGHSASYRERGDIAVARAVASLPVLAEWLLPLLRVGGAALCPQSHRQTARLDEIFPIIERHFPGTLCDVVVADQSALPGHEIVVMAKSQRTPAEYPRSSNEMQRRPLVPTAIAGE